MNDKQLLIGSKTVETLRQTADDSSRDSVQKLIDSIKSLISQPVDDSLESDLEQRAATIRVSFVFCLYSLV